ncbi:MAG: ATP-binding protein [Myxococcota bacterium]|nr:ATP-binding protein [Myxococcota bacterium]
MSRHGLVVHSDLYPVYLEAVLAHVSDAVAIVDGSGRLRCASPQMREIVGFDPADLVGRRVLSFVHPDDRPTVLRLFAAMDADESSARKVVARIPQAKGQLGHYQLSASRIHGPSGEDGLIVSMCDVTERLRLEGELSRVQRLESIARLAGAVAHDYNNLLTAIRSFAVFAREAVASGESPDDDLQEILVSTDRGEALSRQLLAFARRQLHQPHRLDLAELMRGAGRLLERLAGERYRLTVDVQEGIWPVHGDPAQLEQCLINLVMNATEAMPDGGDIDIAVTNLAQGYDDAVEPLEGECVSLAIKDRGPGLCPKAREHLFEPFFTTKDPGKGVGTGLAVVYGVVRKHGGRVVVETATGRGTTVRLVLPRALERKAHSTPVAVAPRAPMVGVALVVEDDDLVRSVISRTLVKQGLVVHECSDGLEALDVAAILGEELDLLVTDVAMPRMDGTSLATVLRERVPALPAVFVTGYSADAVALVGMLGSRDRLVRKPFTAGGLVEAVSDLLAPAVR